MVSEGLPWGTWPSHRAPSSIKGKKWPSSRRSLHFCAWMESHIHTEWLRHSRAARAAPGVNKAGLHTLGPWRKEGMCGPRHSPHHLTVRNKVPQAPTEDNTCLIPILPCFSLMEGCIPARSPFKTERNKTTPRKISPFCCSEFGLLSPDFGATYMTRRKTSFIWQPKGQSFCTSTLFFPGNKIVTQTQLPPGSSRSCEGISIQQISTHLYITNLHLFKTKPGCWLST